MATYKVLQDIEADDKLVWNLSFRQFVYALIAVFMLYISYIFISKHVAFMVIITAPIMLFTGFLAFPFGKDQPTEIWALAKLRFALKPRKRIWAQSGVKELVTITVPKKIEVDLTNGLSQTEVKSRLQALANTIDSRGWAVKNVSSIYQNPLDESSSDRLISTDAFMQSVSDDNVPDSEDVLDVTANPVAQKMDQLINASDSMHRQQLMQTLDQIKATPAPNAPQAPSQNVMSSMPPANVGIASTSPYTPSSPPTNSYQAPAMSQANLNYSAPSPSPTPDETGILNQLKSLDASQHSSLNHMRTLRSDADKPAKAVASKEAASPVTTVVPAAAAASTTTPDPVIMNLSKRNDLNVTVIAHEANKAKASSTTASDGEVLISLH